jgi:hypothetical protein
MYHQNQFPLIHMLFLHDRDAANCHNDVKNAVQTKKYFSSDWNMLFPFSQQL